MQRDDSITSEALGALLFNHLSNYLVMLQKGGKDIVTVLVTVQLIELNRAWLTNMRESTRARETRL